MEQRYRYAPFKFTPEHAMSLSDRLRMFLGHHDLRIWLTDSAYIDLDRGSFDAALHVRFVKGKTQGLIGTVGQFCDFSETSVLFGGGNHQNHLPVNVVMAHVPMFRSTIKALDIPSLRW